MKKSKSIKSEIIKYLRLGNPMLKKKIIPMNKSLLEIGYLDSYGVIELVTFVEKNFKVQINDNELTKEKFGSINKMVNLIEIKLNKQSKSKIQI